MLYAHLHAPSFSSDEKAGASAFFGAGAVFER
jgi:hypothetical protein